MDRGLDHVVKSSHQVSMINLQVLYMVTNINKLLETYILTHKKAEGSLNLCLEMTETIQKHLFQLDHQASRNVQICSEITVLSIIHLSLIMQYLLVVFQPQGCPIDP